MTRTTRLVAYLGLGALVAATVLCSTTWWISGWVLKHAELPDTPLLRVFIAAVGLYVFIGLIVFVVRAVRHEDDLLSGGALWPLVLIFEVPREVREWRERKEIEQRAQVERFNAEVLHRRTRGVQLSRQRSAMLVAIKESSKHIEDLVQQVPSASARAAADVLLVRQATYVEKVEELAYLSEWLEQQATELRTRAKREQTRSKVEFVMQRVEQIDTEVTSTRDFLIDSEASLLAVIATQDEQGTSRWFARYSEEFERHYEVARAIQAELAIVRGEYEGV